MSKKLTVKDLYEIKGKKKLVSILVKNIEEARAADKVGFEMLATNEVDANEKNNPIKNNKRIKENMNLSIFFHQS